VPTSPNDLDLQLHGPLALARGQLDRAAERRRDDEWLAVAWHAPTTQVVVVADGQVPVSADGRSVLWLRPSDVDQQADRLLLGAVDDGRAWFAIAGEVEAGTVTAGLRELGPVLDDDEAGLVVHAIALVNWHVAHPCCSRCGERTEVIEAGHVRRCPVDQTLHFPRTDPAIIVLITDDAGRCLLGRHPAWDPGRYSTLAGFVEPGESLEQALRREVREEVGIDIATTRYAGSQPWPFPSSLMLGFFATAATTEITVDGDEIADARWWSRDELIESVRSGTLAFPGSASIARRLLEAWFGGPLPALPTS
jgi:NAD+ diphosphatase